MELEKKYQQDPTHTLPIPYWKHKQTSVREDMVIVSDEKFNEVLYREFIDTKYYRLEHDLLNLKLGKIGSHYSFSTYKTNDTFNIYNLIKECYKEDELQFEKIERLVKDETFNNLLCVFLYCDKYYMIEKNIVNINKIGPRKEKKLKPIGMIMANFDEETKEASIEYLCIIEKYRKKGLGKLLIQEILLRISNIAEFATVTYPIESEYNLDNLFRSCGFTGDAVWHVLKKQ